MNVLKKLTILALSLNILFGMTAMGQTTFTSVQDGDWNDCTTWQAGPCTSTEGVTYPSRIDEVIINHNVTINAVTDNNAAGGVTPNTIAGVCDVQNFNGCNMNSFLHNGLITIGSGASLTANTSVILQQDVTVNGGSLVVQGNVNNDLFILARLDVINGATLDLIDNLALSLNAISNVDNTSTGIVGDDLVVDGENAVICGNGVYSVDATANGSNAGNNSFIHISANDPSILLDQLCAETSIICEDGNCASGLSTDGDIVGNEGGDGDILPGENPDNNRPEGTTVLPVELLFFNIALTRGQVILDWSTASELNNDFFTVERSQDGLAWERVARLPGAGTTSTQQNYQVTDSRPLPGRSFYRLIQTDFDGSFEVFDAQTIENELDGFVVLTPNPTNQRISILATADLLIQSISITAIDGKVIQVLPNLRSDNSEFSFDLSQYTAGSGLYLIQVQTSAGLLTKRVVLQ